MPNTAEARVPEATYEPVPPKLNFATPLRRLEREPEAEKTRGEITSLFDIAVSPGSVELTPSNFRDLPPELRTAALNGVAELRETFSNSVFGEFPVTAQVHSTLVENMPASFRERVGRRMNGIDRVIVVHQPNMTASAVYYPTTGQFMTSIKEHRTSDFPASGSGEKKSSKVESTGSKADFTLTPGKQTFGGQRFEITDPERGLPPAVVEAVRKNRVHFISLHEPENGVNIQAKCENTPNGQIRVSQANLQRPYVFDARTGAFIE